MKYILTIEQINKFLNALNIAIKYKGISNIEEMVVIFNILNNPLEKNDTTFTYEFSKEDIDSFVKMFDIVLKSEGLNSIEEIVGLINILNSPVIEEEQK